MQVQFVVMGMHTFYIYLTECDYPNGLKVTHMVYMFTLILLFSNFYMKSYTKKSKPASPPSGSGAPDPQADKKHQ